MIRHLSLPLVALALATSCGGDTSLTPSPVHDIPGVILLDNGDEGEGQVPLADPSPPAGFSSYGFWYTYQDNGTCRDAAPAPDAVVPDVGTVNPKQGDNFTITPYAGLGVPALPETLPNAKDNPNGIRMSGEAHTFFGAGLGFKLVDGYGPPATGINFTAAGLVGIRFWAYTSASPASYRVKYQDKYSTADAGLCVPRTKAPYCEGIQNCENAPGYNIEVTSAWRLYELYFSAAVTDDPATPEFTAGPMVRENWGDTVMTVDGTVIGPNLPGAPDAMFQIQFQTVDGSVPFDLWIDNFGFIVGGGPADNSAAAAAAPAAP